MSATSSDDDLYMDPDDPAEMLMQRPEELFQAGLPETIEETAEVETLEDIAAAALRDGVMGDSVSAQIDPPVENVLAGVAQSISRLASNESDRGQPTNSAQPSLPAKRRLEEYFEERRKRGPRAQHAEYKLNVVINQIRHFRDEIEQSSEDSLVEREAKRVEEFQLALREAASYASGERVSELQRTANEYLQEVIGLLGRFEEHPSDKEIRVYESGKQSQN